MNRASVVADLVRAMIADRTDSEKYLDYVNKFSDDHRPECCQKCGDLWDIVKSRSDEMIADYRNPDMPSYIHRAIRTSISMLTMAQLVYHKDLDNESDSENTDCGSGG